MKAYDNYIFDLYGTLADIHLFPIPFLIFFLLFAGASGLLIPTYVASPQFPCCYTLHNNIGKLPFYTDTAVPKSNSSSHLFRNVNPPLFP